MKRWGHIAVLGWVFLAATGQAADKPVSVVNGVPISREDFIRSYRHQAEQFIAQGVPRDLLGSFGIHLLVLEMLINTELIREVARARGVTISDSDLKKALEAMKKESGFDQAAYEAFAKKVSGSVERYEAMVRTALATQRIFADVDTTVAVTEQEVHDRRRKLTENRSPAVGR